MPEQFGHFKAHVTVHAQQQIGALSASHAKASSNGIGRTKYSKMKLKQGHDIKPKGTLQRIPVEAETCIHTQTPPRYTNKNVEKYAFPPRPCHHYRRWSIWADIGSSMSKGKYTVPDLRTR